MVRVVVTVVGAIALLSAGEAGARNWPSAGGWDITEIDTGCVMSQEYEGQGSTQAHLLLQADGGTGLVVTNSGWSIKEGEEYDLTYFLDDEAYGGAKSKGTRISYRPGFLIIMNPTFIGDFAKAKALDIYRGETVVDELSLRGSGAGIAVLRRCAASVKARLDAEARERAALPTSQRTLSPGIRLPRHPRRGRWSLLAPTGT